MASAKLQPTTDPTMLWHPIGMVPCEQTQAWIRWHDNSQGVTSLAAGRDAFGWSSHGATHWRLITEAEAAAYTETVAYKGVRREFTWSNAATLPVKAEATF